MKECKGYDILKEWPGVDRIMTRLTIIEELLERKEMSPDFKELRLREDILVFVYDEFKQGGSINAVLRESKFLGEGRTANNNFVMKDGSNYPIVFANNRKDDPTKGFIRGEVYAVPPETLLRLDKLRRNGIMYRRSSKFVFLLDQEYQTKAGNKRPSVPCFMYLGVPEFWEKERLWNSPSMIPRNEKHRKYYEFTPKMKNVFARSGVEGYGWPDTSDMFDEDEHRWMM